MKILFLDTAAAAFPKKGEDNQHHCVRVAAALDEDGTQIGSCIRLIAHPGVALDLEAERYHRATSDDFRREGVTAKEATELLVPLLASAQLIVSFNSQFHRRMLTALFQDAKLDISVHPGHEFYCAMNESAPIVKVKLSSSGRWRSPTLQEAHRHFTEDVFQQSLDWGTHATQQVIAVRRIYLGIQRSRYA